MTSLAGIHFTAQATLQEICNAPEILDQAKLPDEGMDKAKTK
jgi:hypothetical protein